MDKSLLSASCRLAFAAFIHDIGKFAERAKVEVTQDKKERHQQIFCPEKDHRYFTHVHAAYTAIAIDTIEKYIPKINNTDTFPFQTDEKDNSIISAAAGHHKPRTFLQEIITTADRLSSAFERSEYAEYNKMEENEDYQLARLVPLFEEFDQITDAYTTKNNTNFKYRYPLNSLVVKNIFPEFKKDITKEEATKEYRVLWNEFLEDIQKIKNTSNWDLFLDSFDTLYALYTQYIPSSSYKNVPDVSLYDHSKSTAALATALWRYHYETKSETLADLKRDDENKFLLIQSDTSGIQNFIFDVGKSTRKAAYKILRGRSFFISLLNECAALKILKALDLPATSQITNAAGKFIILAPNTPAVKSKLEQVKAEINAWLIENFYGQLSITIATAEACQQDFENKHFKQLQAKIRESLASAKLQQFDLCHQNAGVFSNFFNDYDKVKGICCFDGKSPADESVPNTDLYACKLCLDILSCGENLTNKKFISIAEEPSDNGFKSDIFGYYIGWYPTSKLVRLWDITLLMEEKKVFRGTAKRQVNAYVPHFCAEDVENPIYEGLDAVTENGVKTFSHLAVENCKLEDGKHIVKPAIICIKGDIDNLGSIFQKGIKTPTFAILAQLSRQINDFFTVWLPAFQANNKIGKNIYTIFAGGDDFYLVGPWLDLLHFIPILRDKFAQYVCQRPDITFSVGMIMTRSGDDVINMSSMVEEALEQAKSRQNSEGVYVKNAVCCFGQTVSFNDYKELLKEADTLDELSARYGLSIGYAYSLQELCEQALKASNGDFESAIWRSKLVYKTVRLVAQNKNIKQEDKEAVATLITELIGDAIAKYTSNYKIALYTWLYQQREV